jgi:tetratricopeptide (TPR) repeat protein
MDIQDILERAKNSIRVGDHEAAEKLLKSYIAKVPESREACLLLGITFARLGKLSEASDQFITLLARDPNDIEALNNAAVISRRQGNYQEALDYLIQAIELEPSKVEFHYNIGNVHKELGNLKGASLAYARVIELNPGYVQAYNNLGTIYNQLKEFDKSFGVFRKGLSIDQNNPTLHFNYGIALEANGRFEDAANEYRSALRSKPGWLEPINNLGIVLFMQGKHEKAISTFNRVLKTDPMNAEARNNMGVVLADLGRTGEAIKNYRQAIEADPKYTKAILNLERALEASGNFAEAVTELERLVMLTPGNVEIRNKLSGLYLKLERYPEALQHAEASLDCEPENIQALRIKGTALRIMGSDTEAQACFEKILSLDPGNYSFLLDLADIHFQRREYKEAENRIQSYLIRRPNDRGAKMLLGKLFGKTGNRTHALQIMEELSKADPNDTEALTLAAELHKEAGSVEKALRTADTLVNVQGKRATADDLSELNKSLEIYENAVNAYSSSAREMWDRNLKIMASENEGDTQEDDLSMLMGVTKSVGGLEEEIEPLLTEVMETVFDDEENPDLFLGTEPFGEISGEAETPRYDDPLDALAETAPEVPANGSEPAHKEPKAEEPEPQEDWPPPVSMNNTPPQLDDSNFLPDTKTPPQGQAPPLVIQLPPTQPSVVFVPSPQMPMPLAHPPYRSEPSVADSQESIGHEEHKTAEIDPDEIHEAPNVIELLKHLKHLADELPEKEKTSFSQSKLQTNLESVIDSLGNLTIIKESAVDTSVFIQKKPGK